MNNLILHENKIYRSLENDFFTGWEEVEIERARPAVTWKGGKIPFSIWSQIVSFLIWSQKKGGGDEALIHLYYNEKTKEWAPWAFPQIGVGMSVNLDPEDPDYEKQRKKFGSDWTEAGTVHHHCNGAAFSSGTDDKDEEDRDGIHITLGHMTSEELSFHARAIFGKCRMEPKIDSFLEFPNWIQQIPLEKLRHDAMKACLLTASMHEKTRFPKEWKKNLKKEVKKYHPLSPSGSLWDDNGPCSGGSRYPSNRPYHQPTLLGSSAKKTEDEPRTALLMIVEASLRKNELTAETAYRIGQADSRGDHATLGTYVEETLINYESFCQEVMDLSLEPWGEIESALEELMRVRS